MSAIGDIGSHRGDVNGAALAERGFTLIEALVTVAIAALIAGIGFPSLHRAIDFWSFRQAALATATALDAARAQARLTGDRVQFVPASDGAGFAIGAERAFRFPADVRFEGAPQALAFFADGSSSGGQLILASARRRQSFQVSPDTGLLVDRP